MSILESKIPEGPLAEKWNKHKASIKVVSPANKRKLEVIVIGTGLGGASAAASLAELGYKVKSFCYQDSPRRAHSIAAQGGINAAKNYQNDNDSVFRLFHDTIKGGDYRSREANVYRLAEVSPNIIDQCVAQGVPFGREYGGLLANRSFGGVLVSRTFYARGQTGQQLLIGAYQALNRQISKGNVEMYNRHEMLDVVKIDGKARGIVARDLITGEIKRFGAHAVVVASGGYGNVFFLSTMAMGSNGSAAWQCYKKGAFMANPSFVQIHPTCIPVHGDQQSKLTLMSESLRNDGRVWVPKKSEDAKKLQSGEIGANDISEEDRDYYLERRYPSYGNLVPRDVASRAAKERCDEGYGVNSEGKAVFLDFRDAIERLGKNVIEARYGNLFQMYEKITDVDPYKQPMMIYPAIHYSMGGTWVDYNLMSTIPGLYSIGEANFSDHGGNRLGASALMQGLADGYFILPYTIGDYLADEIMTPKTDVSAPEFEEVEKEVIGRLEKLYNIKGTKTVDYFHKKLGQVMWDHAGMSRNAEGLTKAISMIQEIRKDFWKDVKVTGEMDNLNPELEKASRLADFLDIGELMVRDALNRNESCGGHFREESVTEDGEAKRDDKNFANASCWEFKGETEEPVLHIEDLVFENVKLTQRSYK
ncbi:MAG: fumarate reductase/succinate dehydrogenase flavoprotein subunit [Prolixibacteraceae bacterium]|jgi:succinate dehydrogenase / fumarate reductase, flavoprotein subunit|nr:fumarate reductase/succinate dehydrogenase flavoprotein subunit [Prolixibacteraceae bacterium]MBT6764080.1 fumarate reductase/succinate dehydrogenase flavoprotein subunit [Prolixibacteraceae bacterium]MBT6999334.1 fumarate reductase/succinate dehydrogenase flavoprotein subunit [Prolixibacteraceae bacterium]MBT7395443.1 fumarate reductase/succinate dehydrogenase flavoprotein subunit [Prolixibacteraceae bacterium]